MPREAQKVLDPLGRCVARWLLSEVSASPPEITSLGQALKELNKGLAAGGAALEMQFVSKLKIGIHFQAQVRDGKHEALSKRALCIRVTYEF